MAAADCPGVIPVSDSPTWIKTICPVMPAALVIVLLAAAGPASAQLAVSINNRTCGTVTVELPDAPPCGPDGRICSVAARNGFTTRLSVDQAFNENYLRLVARGECPARNMQLAVDCTVKVKRIARVERGVAAPGAPRAYTVQSVVGQATLVVVELTQGICDDQGGVRRCELACRASDQQ